MVSSLCGSPRRVINRSAGRPPSGVTDKPAQFSGPASSPAEGSCDLGEPIGESPPLTSSIPTLLSSQPDLQHHGCPLNRQILQMSHIPAMPTCRRKIAVRTPRGLQPRGGDHPPSVHTIGAQDLHTRSQSPFRFCCHATSTQFAFCRSSQFRLTQSGEDPLKCSVTTVVDAVANARQKISDAASKAQDRVARTGTDLETTIEHNPLMAVLIAMRCRRRSIRLFAAKVAT